MIFHLDADCKGVPGDFMRFLGTDKLESTRIGSLDDWRSVTDSLVPRIQEGDLVVTDTLNLLVQTIRDDVKLRGTKSKSMDVAINTLFEQGAYAQDLNVAAPFIWQPIKNFMARGARVIILVHQKTGDYDDALNKKKGPSLPKSVYESLMGRANHVFRLGKALNDITAEDGVTVEKDTRILFLKESYQDVIKTDASRAVQASWGRGWMLDPTLAALREMLGFDPTSLAVYGPPGVGKTTFALSDLLEETSA